MIRLLSEEVVKQIAAGEVIERPFSVLKELLENCIDAGAERIEIDLEEGGRTLVRVSDDGKGMTSKDLDLVFSNHATSKLAAVEDLQAIVSLGFRGEALASIGAVSRARILSRAQGTKDAHEIRSSGDLARKVIPAPGPQGTLVEVKDLFYNLPARRRFLKTPQAERQRCLEVFTKQALAHVEVAFHLHGKREIRLQGGESLKQRVGRLFGQDVEGLCLPVLYERAGLRISGLLVDPDGARRDRSQEHLFLNGRPIKNRSLSHAIFDAYRSYLMSGRYPVTFLFMQMDPARVDVNVHPTKAEVRFHDESLVYSALRQAVLLSLTGRKSRFAGHLEGREAVSEAVPLPATGFPELPKGLFGDAQEIGGSFGRLPGRSPAPPMRRALPREDRASSAKNPFVGASRFLVLKDLYILLETNDGFAVVDQHALHERVIYEKLVKDHREGKHELQKLLIPVILELPAPDKELLLDKREELATAGLVISDFGGLSIQIEAYPAVLRRPKLSSLVSAVLRDLREGLKTAKVCDVHERFHSAACRSAVMAGDRLSEEEIAELLQQAAKLEHPDNCPHGRPTVLNYTTAQLERFFKRKV